MWEFHTGQRIAAFSRDNAREDDALGISPGEARVPHSSVHVRNKLA